MNKTIDLTIDETVEQVFRENPKQVIWYYLGKSVLGFFVGQCMKKYINSQKQLSFSFMYHDLPMKFQQTIQLKLKAKENPTRITNDE